MGEKGELEGTEVSAISDLYTVTLLVSKYAQ